MILYVGEKDYGKLGQGTVVSVGGQEFTPAEISEAPLRLDESIDPYLIHLTGLSVGDWAYTVRVDAAGVKDGTYSVAVITERVRPIDFVLN